MAGYNLIFDVERINYSPDDIVGGAVTTGTVLHQGVFGRLQGNPPEAILLMQGIETPRTFRMTVRPGNLDIRERDYVRVTFPPNHPYYNQNLRIVGVTFSNFVPDDPRNYMIVDVMRSVEAHRIQ